MPIDSKKCSHCGKTLPLSMFSKNSAQRDGYNNECKDCVSRYQKEARYKYKEKPLKSPLKKLRYYCRKFGTNTQATNYDAEILVQVVEEYKEKYLRK